jgi:transketolase
MALAEAYLAQHFNRDGHEIVDHRTYALVSDGDMMEGVAIEASALAGHWGLHKLTFLYDDNKVTLDGKADMTLSENIRERYENLGWHIQYVEDGNDLDAIDAALEAAEAETDKPSFIAVNTIIGYGSPNKANTSSAHGSPLGEEEVKLTKENLGWPYEEPFTVPDDVRDHFRQAVERGQAAENAWDNAFAQYKSDHPELAAEYERTYTHNLAEGWDADLPVYGEDDEPMATRNAIGGALNAIAPHVPTMIGGDADLAGSTKTLIDDESHTEQGQVARNVRYGVREHGMGAITNGLALHGGIIKPYSATFLVFSDYMRPTIRLGALMDIPTVYIFTHDSIGLGEDGPTHQPVEHVMSLRAIPNLHVFRPGDANEMIGAWKAVMTLEHPAAVIGTRQKLPVLAAENVEGIHEGVARGAYILAESASIKKGRPEVIIMATGSEVSIALEAFAALDDEGIKARVVSMPCWELFEAQDEGYQEAVLPSQVTARVSIEAGTPLGWERYTGSEGIIIGVDDFGASAPWKKIFQEYGLTAEAVVEAVGELVD